MSSRAAGQKTGGKGKGKRKPKANASELHDESNDPSSTKQDGSPRLEEQEDLPDLVNDCEVQNDHEGGDTEAGLPDENEKNDYDPAHEESFGDIDTEVDEDLAEPNGIQEPPMEEIQEQEEGTPVAEKPEAPDDTTGKLSEMNFGADFLEPQGVSFSRPESPKETSQDDQAESGEDHAPVVVLQPITVNVDQKEEDKKPDADFDKKSAPSTIVEPKMYKSTRDPPPYSNENVILHVMLVSFHHRYGPQVEYCYPPLPEFKVKSSIPDSNTTHVPLPLEWNFLPFMCLPDGAHSTENDFIHFHLPPTAALNSPYDETIFGFSCYRQMKADELITKSSDVTRTMVQKAVVVLAREPVLASFQQKLGLVTQALFDQRDFSTLDILDVLYENLNQQITRKMITDARLQMGLSLRDLINTFKSRTMILFKALLLEYKVIFYGKTVEKVSSLQYALCSLYPELLTHLRACGSPDLDDSTEDIENTEEMERSTKENNSDSIQRLVRNKQFGLPLRLFGKGSFFQPYIPLQQMDVLLAPTTKSFLVGTTNEMFTTHNLVKPHIVANVDTGLLDIRSDVKHDVGLTPPDRKFVEMIVKIVTDTETTNEYGQFILFEGGDDDIRQRFTSYIESLLAATQLNNVEQKDRLATLAGEANAMPLELSSNTGTAVNNSIPTKPQEKSSLEMKLQQAKNLKMKGPSTVAEAEEDRVYTTPPGAFGASFAEPLSSGLLPQKAEVFVPESLKNEGEGPSTSEATEESSSTKAPQTSAASVFQNVFQRGGNNGTAPVNTQTLAKLNEFGPHFNAKWVTTNNYERWTKMAMNDGLYELAKPEHPFCGVNIFDAYHSTFTNTFTDLSAKFKSAPQEGPARHDLNAFKDPSKSPGTSASSSPTRQTATTASDSTESQNQTAATSASQIFSSWGNWMNQKKREWSTGPPQ